jgi:hypothetical protein
MEWLATFSEVDTFSVKNKERPDFCPQIKQIKQMGILETETQGQEFFTQEL